MSKKDLTSHALSRTAYVGIRTEEFTHTYKGFEIWAHCPHKVSVWAIERRCCCLPRRCCTSLWRLPSR